MATRINVQDKKVIVYKSELERHLEAGTMPPNPTKESPILAYEIPAVQETSNIA
jgi:hypothetical protein